MKVLCVGRCVLDVVVAHAGQLPAKNAPATARSVVMQPGGGAATTAAVLKRLGHDVCLLSSLADDRVGRIVAGHLQALDINIDCVTVIEGETTSMSIVSVDDYGQARYLYTAEADIHTGPDQLSLAFDQGPYDWLHAGGYNLLVDDDGEPLVSFFREIRKRYPAIRISADSSKVLHAATRLAPMAPELDVFFANRAEAESATDKKYFEDVAHRIREMGVRAAAIIKDEKHGAFWDSDGEQGHVPAYRVPKVVDENGAGDVFCAGVIAALADRVHVQAAVERGNLLAAYHIETPGGVAYGDAEVGAERLKDYADSHSRSMQTPGNPLMDERLLELSSEYAVAFDKWRQLDFERQAWWGKTVTEHGKLHENAVMVDAGCGTGRFTFSIQSCSHARIIAVDRSRVMLDVARRKPGAGRITWAEGNLEHLSSLAPVRQNPIQAVFISQVMHQLGAATTQFLRECYDALEDGGRILVRTLTPELISLVGYYRYFDMATHLDHERFLNVEEIVQLLSAAGFRLVHAELRDDGGKMEKQRFIELFEARPFSWCYEYREREYASCIESMRHDLLTETHAPYPNPTYLIVGEKLGRGGARHRDSGGGCAGRIAGTKRTKVFISYSRKNANWLKRFRVHLRPLEREGLIECWDDTRIGAGDRWREEIERAVDESAVAVFLVSADFLASDFVHDVELPKLIGRAEAGGVRILPVIVGACLYEASALARFESLNAPEEPLEALPRPDQETALLDAARSVREVIGRPVLPS